MNYKWLTQGKVKFETVGLTKSSVHHLFQHSVPRHPEHWIKSWLNPCNVLICLYDSIQSSTTDCGGGGEKKKENLIDITANEFSINYWFSMCSYLNKKTT